MPVVLAACIAAVLCVPAGFAIAQATLPEAEAPVAESHEDPDPKTDPRLEMEALKRAAEGGSAVDQAEAAEAVRQEILSRSGQAEREAAETAPPEPDVPPGTKTYIAPSVPDDLVSGCKADLAGGSGDELCEMIVLHDEGKLRSGAFTEEQQAIALQEAK